jgi:poly(3-hydroxybutyrate) depolymerase
VICPSVTVSYDCWDVTSSQALTRNGGSDPVGLMSMVTYAEQHYGGNPNAVYVTGESSGAMMTNVLLAEYPDVSKAGAAFMACRTTASTPAPSAGGTPPAPAAG